ncbi:serine/threonine-protein kinase M1, partial [Gamsiella multidivaricata]
TQTSSEAIRILSESLKSMINTASSESAKLAFSIDRIPVPPSLTDKPRQRLEWLVLSCLVPLLAVPSLSTIHRDLVIKALHVVRLALSLSEDASQFIVAPGIPQRTNGFHRAVLGILKEVSLFLKSKNLTFPSDCTVKMSAIKGVPGYEIDPAWMAMRFSSLEDAVRVLCFLLPFLCPEIDNNGSPAYKDDEELRIDLLALTDSLLKTFLPDGDLARRDRTGIRQISANPTSILQLYQACSHCILKTVYLLNADNRLFTSLAESLMRILYHHIMTIEDRCKEWSIAFGTRAMAPKVKLENFSSTSKHVAMPAMTVKDCRSEMPAVTALEVLLAKSLMAVMECAFESFPDTVELREIRPLLANLLLSEQLLLLNEDSSGRSVQRAIFLLMNKMVTSGAFKDPLRAVDHVLSYYTHLELDLLVRFVRTCIDYWRALGGRDLLRESHRENGIVTNPKTPQEQAFGGFAIKRPVDEADYDQHHHGNLDLKGKRVRRSSPIPNSPSIESTNCSSILSYSQFSQRIAMPNVAEDNMPSPSALLLSMFKRLVSTQALSYTASQGSRGIQPPLTIEDLKAAVVVVQVWAMFALDRSSTEAGKGVDQLTTLVESIGKYYILWALSPGMQDPSRNLSYLESSFPLMLDLIAPLALIRPWFAELSAPELWRSTEGSMNIDEITGRQQLANGLRVITEGTEILSRLRDNPDILGSCQGFAQNSLKALRVMSTFSQCPQLDVWRKDITVRSLRDHSNDRAQDTGPKSSSGLVIAALESFAVLSTRCPELKWTVRSALGYLALSEHSEETKITLAYCMGIIACGSCSTNQQHGPKYTYDALNQLFSSNWICQDCELPSNGLKERLQEKAWPSTEHLDPKFLDSFKQLIPNCVSVKPRLALLRGLYRVFCHLNLVDCDLKSLDFGSFLLSNLCDPTEAIRRAAGDIAELVAMRAGSSLADDLFGKSGLEDSLGRINEAISKGFSAASRSQRAEDKGLSNYRFIRPQMEYVCTRVLEKLDGKQDQWLEALFYPWTGLSPTGFIEPNLPELVPKMILLHSRSLIEKVASIFKEPADVLCIRQLDHILAAIYMQLSDEHFQPCIQLLLNLISKPLGIADLTTLSTEGLLCCLSVELGHEDPLKRDKAKKVIEFVEEKVWENSKREQAAQGKVAERPPLALFLRRHVLAILAEMNNAIQDTSQIVPLRTKAKYLRSLIPLVQLLDPIQNSVLSQIFSPLDIALNTRGLRLHALLMLNGVLHLVKPAQLDGVLGHVVHTMIKYYPSSNEKERAVELEILQFLILQLQVELGAVLPDVRYLPDLPEFEEMNRVLKEVKTRFEFEPQLKRLIDRSADERAELAEQAILELREFLLAHEHQLLEMTTTKDKDVAPIVNDLIRALLSGIGRFRGLDAPVPRRCIECLGIIGAVDPAKLSTMRLIPTPPGHTNFNDPEEAKNFVCRLIESGVLEATMEVLTPRRSLPGAPSFKTPADRWKAFPRHVQEVLELLIDAKYSKPNSTDQRTYPSPLYPHVGTFKEWLTFWTLALIGKVSGRYAKEIFQACKSVVPYDTNTCLYILPHLVLLILLEGTENDRKEIVEEMAAVLGSGRSWRQEGVEQTLAISKQSFSELNQLGSQTVFGLFDHISKWIQLRKAPTGKTPTPRGHPTASDLSQIAARAQDPTVNIVQAHLTSISHDVIAMASFKCRAYARSLLHYEQCIRDARQQRELTELDFQTLYEKHQEIYAHMEEPDGMAGISGLITSGSPTQNLLQCESAGGWIEAQAYYELGLQANPGKYENHAGLYKCLENLGHFNTLLTGVEGDIQTHPEWEQQLNNWRIASAWKVQNWQSLEVALSRSVHSSFETGLGQLVLDLRDNRVVEFEEHLQQVRAMLIAPLAAASMESYARAIPTVVSYSDLNYLKESCGHLWLESARAARKSGNSQVSYSAMLHAEEFKNHSAAIERAKWEFIHKHERQAIKTIDSALKRSLVPTGPSVAATTRAISSSITNRLRQTSSSGRRAAPVFNTELQRVQDREIDRSQVGYIRARAHLLRTRWVDRGSLVSPNDILEGYRQATVECDYWEKGYYAAGQYFLKLYEGTRRYKARPPTLGYLTTACRLYGKALTLGPKYLYQALPRLLTFWLDLGYQAILPKADAASIEFQNVNKLMEGLAGYLPEYMFLSAFPQIISRICHKSPDAFGVLQHIIVNVVLAFPDQAIWQMVSVSRSVVGERKRVCNKILDNVHLRPQIGAATVEQIKEALDLCDNLIALCMAPVPDKVDKLSLEKHFSRQYSQLRQHYNVTVPCQRALWPTLPESSATVASHQPFKSNLPKVERFMDEVEVMSSLQRPRKITIVGSDGVNYTFLCKPKDDLRKDAKVMEFNGLVNMLLRKDREASRRNLYIRTYSVIPLNEECGLIEWVHNTIPFRHIMQKQYKINNVNLLSIAEIKRILDHEDHVRMFVKDLLPRFPPIFYQWFIDISAEPTAWFETRLRYTRTTAVMSMVGYIMGLGDRHGENLLFDDRNGDIVHVDFNCLFEQGKTFPKPEKVPFRLTQNMIDAMGLSGYDGVYRLACEQTLQVFRDNTESLVSVLEGFIHDPLVEWSKSKRRGQQIQQEAARAAAVSGIGDSVVGDGGALGGADEVRARLRSKAKADAAVVAAAAEVSDPQQNEKAQAILTIIKRKLSGTESPNMYMLSVQGQIEELIQSATSADNLSKMYIGWSAYL